MGNHIHIIGVPRHKFSLGRALNTLTMRYPQYVNRKRKSCGHVWQGRYFSCVLDETHLYRAIRYVERNPVRAKMVNNASDYKWSSARIHIGMHNERLISLGESFDMSAKEWKMYLREEDSSMVEEMRLKTKRGSVVGPKIFIKNVKKILKRPVKCLNPGRPKKKREKGS